MVTSHMYLSQGDPGPEGRTGYDGVPGNAVRKTKAQIKQYWYTIRTVASPLSRVPLVILVPLVK